MGQDLGRWVQTRGAADLRVRAWMQVLLGVGGYTMICFMFNMLDELTPIFAAAPISRGGESSVPCSGGARVKGVTCARYSTSRPLTFLDSDLKNCCPIACVNLRRQAGPDRITQLRCGHACLHDVARQWGGQSSGNPVLSGQGNTGHLCLQVWTSPRRS